MALFLNTDARSEYTDQDTGAIGEPTGAQDGNLQFIVQAADIGGFVKPAGWLDVPGVTSDYINLQLWWGIRGVHFSGGVESLAGNSDGRATSLLRFEVTGDVDETCIVLGDSLSYVTGEFGTTGYAYPPSIDLSAYPNRPRLLCTFGGQEKVGGPFNSFDGAGGMSDTPFVNRLTTGADDCSFLFNYLEDNAAIRGSNAQHKYYVWTPHDPVQRTACANFVILGPEKKQTDVMAPPVVF